MKNIAMGVLVIIAAFVLILSVFGGNKPSINPISNITTERIQIEDIESTIALPTPTQVKEPTTTRSPTLNQTPTPMSQIEQSLVIHERERLEYLEIQGPAETIPALEYHGDEYHFNFSGFICEIDQDAFSEQMEWFKTNQVHSITGDELIKWLNGKIELPRKSIVLTFDIVGEIKSHMVPRIAQTMKKHGMHGILTIKTMNMGSSDCCPGTCCWEDIRKGYETGVLTIGSHSVYHVSSPLLSKENGLIEFSNSKSIIEEGVGNDITVNILTWPYEDVPTWKDSLTSIGFEIAFAGTVYPLEDNTIHRNRVEDRYLLPRVLPPNSDGLSIRPFGKTLQEMMGMYWKGE